MKSNKKIRRGQIEPLNNSDISNSLGYVPENAVNKQDSLAVDGTGEKYPTVDAVNDEFATKQDNLVSGVNIKTIEGQSILGSGNIDLSKNDVGLSNVPNIDTTDPNNIIQDSTHRFVTDSEKTYWNSKEDALGFTPENVINKQNSLSVDGSGIKYPTVDAVNDALDLKQDLSEKGQPDGYASLDSGGKIPATQLPNSVMELQGEWNATTNTPVLIDGIGNPGDVWKVTTAGTQNLGSGNISFENGDFAIYGSSGIWFQSDNTDAVNSVFGRLGTVTAQNGDYDTSLVPETTDKNYQTDNQKLYNDATSSIQTQLNSKENLANKQLTPFYDGTGQKYPSLDLMNNNFLVNTQLFANTGITSSLDTFDFEILDANTLRIKAVSRAFFYNETIGSGKIANDGFKSFPQKDYPLDQLITATGGNINTTPLTTDGKYVRYLGYDKDGNVVSSPTDFILNKSVAQLGFVTVIKTGSTVAFLELTVNGRNIFPQPILANTTDLERTKIGLTTDVVVNYNTGAPTLKSSNATLKLASGNWRGANNPTNSSPIDQIAYTGQATLDFGAIDKNFLTSTGAITVISNWTTAVGGVAWNEGFFNATTNLVGTMNNNTFSAMKVMQGVRGGVFIQRGEHATAACFSSLDVALANYQTIFSEAIFPPSVAVPVAYIIYKKSVTDFNNPNDFRILPINATVSGGSPIVPVGDATTVSKGIIQLAGDFDATSTATNPLIKTATASVSGKLTSTDWNTFNNKIGGTGTTNTIPKFTASGTIGNSNITDTSTLITLSTNTDIKGNSNSNGASLGSELLTTGSGTNWSGTDYTSGYTHTIGSTTGLTSTFTPTTNNVYRLSITVTSRTTGGVTINVGGNLAGAISSNTTLNYDFLSINTSALTITPTTDFDGVVTASIKQYIAYSAIVRVRNSSNTILNEERYINNNLFNGIDSGKHITSGTGNVASGLQSQYSLTSGSYNVASGLQSQYSLTSGTGNVASGLQSQSSLTTGNYNVASGYLSQSSLTTGNNNVASGYQSQFSLTSGNNNVASGYQSQYSLTSGSYNVASGLQSQYSLTTGTSNVASGYLSQYSLTSGSYNVASGRESQYSLTSGTGNVASGLQSQYSLTTGNYNVASGYLSQSSLTTGNNNVASGYQSQFSLTSGNNNVASGYQSQYSLTTGNYNVASGLQSQYSLTTGTSNVASGYLSQRYLNDKVTELTTSNNSIFIGYRTSSLAQGQSNEIVIGHDANGNGSNSVTLGNDSITKTILRGRTLFGTTTDNGVDIAQFTGSTSTSGQIKSTIATGTAPLQVASTTNVTNLNADLLDGQHGSYYAPIASPALTGTPTAPTPTAGDNSTKVATTAYVDGAISTAGNGYVKTTGNQTITGVKDFTTSSGGSASLQSHVSGSGVVGASFVTSNSGTACQIIGSNSTGVMGLMQASGASSGTILRLENTGTSTNTILNARDTSGATVFNISNTGATTATSFAATNGTIRLKGYTVATLPVGVQGDTAYVTDATSPTYLGVVTGGGSVVCPVFFNGTNWVSH